MAKSVVGLFSTRNDAQAALSELESAGFSGNNLTFVDQAGSRFSSLLTQAGIPESDATIYANGVQQGGALIMLQALSDQDASRAAGILDRHNIVDITGRQGFSQATTTRDTTRGGMTNLYQGNDVAIPIIEEELRIGKREVEQGGVRVNTRVESVPVNEQVTLRDETIDIHRKPVNREVTNADLTAVQSGTFEVRERDEQAIVDKQARVVEEVHIKKNVEERTENIQDTVRRTDVNVQQVGGTTGYAETGTAQSVGYTGSTSSTGSDEGIIERGGSKLGNAVERGTGIDVDRDGDVGQRDPRNNI